MEKLKPKNQASYKLITDENKREIFYHIINSFLAGALVFLGAITAGNVSLSSMGYALAACLVVMITKFRDYWNDEAKEYSKTHMLNFI